MPTAVRSRRIAHMPRVDYCTRQAECSLSGCAARSNKIHLICVYMCTCQVILASVSTCSSDQTLSRRTYLPFDSYSSSTAVVARRRTRSSAESSQNEVVTAVHIPAALAYLSIPHKPSYACTKRAHPQQGVWREHSWAPVTISPVNRVHASWFSCFSFFV